MCEGREFKLWTNVIGPGKVSLQWVPHGPQCNG